MFHLESGKRLFPSPDSETDICEKLRSWRIGEEWQIKATVMVLPSPGSVIWALDCCEVKRNYKGKSNVSLGKNNWAPQSSKGTRGTIHTSPYPRFAWPLPSCHAISTKPSYCHLCQDQVLKKRRGFVFPSCNNRKTSYRATNWRFLFCSGTMPTVTMER